MMITMTDDNKLNVSDELQKVMVSAQETGNIELVETYQSLLDRINKNKAGVDPR